MSTTTPTKREKEIAKLNKQMHDRWLADATRVIAAILVLRPTWSTEKLMEHAKTKGNNSLWDLRNQLVQIDAATAQFSA